MSRVYLAGPISGCSYEECTGWRRDVVAALEPLGIRCFSPMRHKGYLAQESVIGDSYPQTVLSTSRAIMTRDYHDCQTADCLLVNLLGCKRVTIGTVMEIAWAYALQIPVVCVMEPENNPHDHAMIREAIGFRVTTLADGIACVHTVLCPE